MTVEEYLHEGLKEVDRDEFYSGDNSEFSFVTFQASTFEQVTNVIFPLLKLIGVTEFTSGRRLNRNAGFAGHMSPSITVKLPRKCHVSTLDVCLGAFGSKVLLDF
jgi:hypothetical protein